MNLVVIQVTTTYNGKKMPNHILYKNAPCKPSESVDFTFLIEEMRPISTSSILKVEWLTDSDFFKTKSINLWLDSFREFSRQWLSIIIIHGSILKLQYKIEK